MVVEKEREINVVVMIKKEGGDCVEMVDSDWSKVMVMMMACRTCRWWMRAGRGGQRGFHCKTKAGWPTTISAHLQLTKKERVLITDMQLGTARSLSEAKLEQIYFHPNTI